MVNALDYLAAGFQERVQRQKLPRTLQDEPLSLGLSDLVIATSKALDLLEGRSSRSAIRVAMIAATLAEKIGLSSRQKTSLLYAGLLHDIGLVKIAADIAPRLPEDVTEKKLFAVHPLRLPETVSVTTIDRLQTHPLLAAEFIDGFGLSLDVKGIIACSHEHMDGGGYPNGLRDQEIPIESRILAFADAIEACMEGTTGVGQRKESVANFLKTVGTLWFDSAVIDAFQAVYMGVDSEGLKHLYTMAVEDQLRQTFSKRRNPLSVDELLNAVQTMGTMVDAYQGTYTIGQSQKTAVIAYGIAQELKIPAPQQAELIIAALLANLGMLAVPMDVLLKSDSLTDEEWAVVKEHPRHTEKILRAIPGFENIALWAGEHHEKMNGSGYPNEKKGFEISVGGRILALADNYTALSQPRPYRAPYEPLDALPLIGQGRSRLYDSPLVSILRHAVLDSEYVVH